MRRPLVAVVAAIVVAAIAVGVTIVATRSAPPPATPSLVLPASRCAHPASPEAMSSVPVRVVKILSGEGLLASVCIDGQGPFPFIVDTGASKSAVSTGLAAALHLPQAGAANEIKGLACTTTAVPSTVASWAIGSLPLSPQTLLAVSLPQVKGISFDGLLGSDVLSRFGAVRFDVRAASLRFLSLEAPASSDGGISNFSPPDLPASFTGPVVGAALELSVIRSPGYVSPLVSVSVSHRKLNFFVDTGAAVTAIAKADAAALPPTGRTQELTTAGCLYRAALVTAPGWSVGGPPPLLGVAGSTSVDPGTDRTLAVPSTVMVGVPLPQTSGPVQVAGSLGMDVLSSFGAFVLDYRDAALVVVS